MQIAVDQPLQVVKRQIGSIFETIHKCVHVGCVWADMDARPESFCNGCGSHSGDAFCSKQARFPWVFKPTLYFESSQESSTPKSPIHAQKNPIYP